MWPVVVAILAVLLLVALIGVAALWRARGVLTQRLTEAEREADALREAQSALTADLAVARSDQSHAAAAAQERDKLRQENSDLLRRLERIDADRQALADLHKKIDQNLANVATRSLQESGKQFLELAKKTFEKEQGEATAALDQRRVAIEEMLKPIRETLGKHAEAVAEVEKRREHAYGSLNERLTQLRESQLTLGRQTTALTTALRGSSSTRGRWGEITLRRIAELAGMVGYCDFDEQITFWKGEAQQRPDMIVNLPANRQVVVDAKSVGQSYLAACESEDEAERAELLKKHLRDIESRIKDLGSKAYTESLPRSVDFVVLFIPGDSFLSPAVSQRPDLIEWAMNRHVVIATPTTLISLLKAIELGWREQEQAENARQIAELGRELHQRIATALEHAEKLGRNLQTAVKAYNSFVGSMENKVLPQARRFKELRADSPKELPAEGALTQVEIQPRELRTSSTPDDA